MDSLISLRKFLEYNPHPDFTVEYSDPIGLPMIKHSSLTVNWIGFHNTERYGFALAAKIVVEEVNEINTVSNLIAIFKSKLPP